MKIDKKICFITELPFFGKVKSNHKNMRTEFAWMNCLDADNINISNTKLIGDGSYDIGIIIIPKQLEKYQHFPILSELKRICKFSAFMQEGPAWYYKSLPISLSMLQYEIMENVDFVLAHNDCDKLYFEGLLNKPTFINPTLMIKESIGNIIHEKRKNVIVGGNLGEWYGGFDSYVVASQFKEECYFPSMGRMKKEEMDISGINHIPYMELYDWIRELNKFKYAVHMNSNTIGGTFNLNCAFLGIPCIGNIKSNTQRLCFPHTSVDVNEIGKAKKIAKKLKEDEAFYNKCSEIAQKSYEEFFSEIKYKQHMKIVFDTVL